MAENWILEPPGVLSTPGERARQAHNALYAEASNGDVKVISRVVVPEAYTVTYLAMVEVVRRVLRGEAPAGSLFLGAGGGIWRIKTMQMRSGRESGLALASRTKLLLDF